MLLVRIKKGNGWYKNEEKKEWAVVKKNPYYYSVAEDLEDDNRAKRIIMASDCIEVVT